MYAKQIPMQAYYIKVTPVASVWTYTFTTNVLLVSWLMIVSTSATAGNRKWSLKIYDDTGVEILRYQPIEAMPPSTPFVNMIFIPGVSATLISTSTGVQYVPFEPIWMRAGESAKMTDDNGIDGAGDTYSLRCNYYTANGETW